MTRWLSELLAEDHTSNGEWALWHDRVAEYLANPPAETVHRVDGVGPSWALLGWAEMAASRAVRMDDSSLLRLGIAAVALVDEWGAVDGRDARVVGGLLRRVCDLLGLGIGDETQAASRLLVVVGVGNRLFEWLAAASPTSNLLHEEIGEGASFTFARKPNSIDIHRLQARFGRSPTGLEEGLSDV